MQVDSLNVVTHFKQWSVCELYEGTIYDQKRRILTFQFQLHKILRVHEKGSPSSPRYTVCLVHFFYLGSWH